MKPILVISKINFFFCFIHIFILYLIRGKVFLCKENPITLYMIFFQTIKGCMLTCDLDNDSMWNLKRNFFYKQVFLSVIWYL
jgi:hypothetical protein